MPGSAAARARRAAFLLTTEYEWAVGAMEVPLADVVAQVVEQGSLPDAPVRWLTPAPEPFGFLADPRGVTWRGERWAFFEAFLPWRGRGVIAAAPYREGLGFGPVRTVLDLPRVHLAYPTVLVDGDDLVCVPDASDTEGVPVFRGRSPGELAPAGHLRGVPPLGDPTIWNDGDDLFLVGLDRSSRPAAVRAFRASSLAGPWEAVGAPIPDVDRDARPGGDVVPLTDGRLVRVAQDGRERYGSGIVVREVSATDGYSERRLARAGPPAAWDFPSALHTLSGDGGVTYVDGYRLRRTALAAPHRLARHLAVLTRRT